MGGSGLLFLNLSPARLIEGALSRREGLLSREGAFVAVTTPYTGRSPRDKFLVEEPSSQDDIDWGPVNQSFEEARFEALLKKVQIYLSGRDLFVWDAYVCADPAFGLSVRLTSELAWANLFAHHLFLLPNALELANFIPDLVIYHAPHFKADPKVDGTKSEAFIILHFGKKMVLIGGTSYAGEIKKAVFTFLNYLLPFQGVLPMHCSANVGAEGDVSLFFGLSGTGKTSLSADPRCRLIGDDEHGWGPTGIFNFEGGCYAKVIRLSLTAEPQIFAAAHRFGTVLENVVLDPQTLAMDLESEAITENTRAAYPIHDIENAVIPGVGGHPKNTFFLSADAFGVLPPIAKLNHKQAMEYFLAGYTAKVAGTEKGIKEPQATFSACFALPFLPRDPLVYSRMLGEKIKEHKAQVWLINTGWSGGAYGVGERIKIAYTRAMIQAAQEGKLNRVSYETDPIFGLSIPTACPGVPSKILNPRNAWADPEAYDRGAKKLAAMFAEKKRL